MIGDEPFLPFINTQLSSNSDHYVLASTAKLFVGDLKLTA